MVNAATKVLFNDHNSASLSDIAADDTVNVYGFYDSGTNTIYAEIVRDLSRNPNGGGTAPGNAATLQAELSQLQTLVFQLENELSASGGASSTIGTSTAY
jgi:hypothetical protein